MRKLRLREAQRLAHSHLLSMWQLGLTPRSDHNVWVLTGGHSCLWELFSKAEAKTPAPPIFKDVHVTVRGKNSSLAPSQRLTLSVSSETPVKALRGPAARTMTSYCSWSHLTTVPRETGVPRNIPWETWSRDSMNHHPRLTKARGSQCRFTPAGYGVHICAKSLQSCPTLCNSVGSSLPDASVCGVSRQEYWSGLPCSPPGDLPNPGIKPTSLALAGKFFTTSATWEAPMLRS